MPQASKDDSPASGTTELTEALKAYVANQHRNRLTSFLHSIRYKRLTTLTRALANGIPERPLRVLDIGSAQCGTLTAIAPIAPIDYYGLESERRFFQPSPPAGFPAERFHNMNVDACEFDVAELPQLDLAVALETFEHIGEARSFELLRRLHGHGVPRLFITVPSEVGPSIWVKNVGSAMMGYDRYREYTWIETLNAGLYRLDKLPAHDYIGPGMRGHKGFDWRWLAHSIRSFYSTVKIWSSPYNWLPTSVSPSIHLWAEQPR